MFCFVWGPLVRYDFYREDGLTGGVFETGRLQCTEAVKGTREVTYFTLNTLRYADMAFA